MTSGARYHLVTTCFVSSFIFGFSFGGIIKDFDFRKPGGLAFGIDESLALKLFAKFKSLLFIFSPLFEKGLSSIVLV